MVVVVSNSHVESELLEAERFKAFEVYFQAR